MNSTSTYGRKKAAVGVGALLLLGASLITVAAAVGAQSGVTSSCSSDNSIQFGSEFFGSADLGNHLLSSGPTVREYVYNLDAGVYEIPAVSTDGYVGRDLVTQPNEQWFVEFLAADGSVLDTTATSGDVEDFVEQGLWTGSLGEVTLEAPAASIRIVHAAPGAPSPNSVRPVCIGATPTGDAPSAIESSITVDFDSENIDASDISVVCAGISESGNGTAVDLVIDPVAPGTVCEVEYPADRVCTVAVTPEDQVTVASGEGSVTVTFPTDVSVDAVVDIDCTDAEVLDSSVNCDDPGEAAAAADAGDTTCDEAVDCSDDAGAEAADAGDTTCDETVDCDDDEAAAAVAADGDTSCTDVLNETVTNPDTTETPDTQVLQEVVDAPVAQSQAGDPTFTG